MGMKDTTERVVTCDRCSNTIASYNPVPNAATKLPENLKLMVGIQDPVAGYETIYCGDICAVEAIGEGMHRKTVQLKPGPKIELAGEAQVKQAIINDNAMKVIKGKK